jgi:hypothetical protein
MTCDPSGRTRDRVDDEGARALVRPVAQESTEAVDSPPKSAGSW